MLNVAKSKVPVVIINWAKSAAAVKVIVPVALTVNIPVDLPLQFTLPVPLITGTKEVNVPPLDSVKLPTMFIGEAPVTVDVILPKSVLLNQSLVESVIAEAPVVNVKLGALAAVPLLPPDPKDKVLVTEASVTKPPVPVHVKLVAVTIASTVCAAVVCAKTILPEPNVTVRTFAVDDENIPHVNVNPAKASVPAVNRYVLTGPLFIEAPSVTVPKV